LIQTALVSHFPQAYTAFIPFQQSFPRHPYRSKERKWIKKWKINDHFNHSGLVARLANNWVGRVFASPGTATGAMTVTKGGRG